MVTLIGPIRFEIPQERYQRQSLCGRTAGGGETRAPTQGQKERATAKNLRDSLRGKFKNRDLVASARAFVHSRHNMLVAPPCRATKSKGRRSTRWPQPLQVTLQITEDDAVCKSAHCGRSKHCIVAKKTSFFVRAVLCPIP